MIYISFDIGIKNLALCILENKDNNITIIDWRVITLADKKKDVNGLNLISEILFYELDNIIGCIEELNYDTIDYVIIENQPSNLNGIMKSIQLLIFSYCKYFLIHFHHLLLAHIWTYKPRKPHYHSF